MPVYEYVCTDCRRKTEALRSMSKADDPIECKFCHGSNTSRALSLFSAYSRGNGTASQSITGGGGCSGCSGGSCSTCGH